VCWLLPSSFALRAGGVLLLVLLLQRVGNVGAGRGHAGVVHPEGFFEKIKRLNFSVLVRNCEDAAGALALHCACVPRAVVPPEYRDARPELDALYQLLHLARHRSRRQRLPLPAAARPAACSPEMEVCSQLTVFAAFDSPLRRPARPFPAPACSRLRRLRARPHEAQGPQRCLSLAFLSRL
jgi:hypothetical protein